MTFDTAMWIWLALVAATLIATVIYGEVKYRKAVRRAREHFEEYTKQRNMQ